VQTQLEGDGEGKDETLKKIQEILYSTEVSIGLSPLLIDVDSDDRYDFQEGFEVPDANAAPVDEEETF
jgi:hypothetical protein